MKQWADKASAEPWAPPDGSWESMGDYITRVISWMAGRDQIEGNH